MKSESYSTFFMLTFLILIGFHTNVHAQNLPRAKQLIGRYERNTAQGWSHPEPGMEVIPALPRYQYVDLKRNGRLGSGIDSVNAASQNQGKWKIHKDTLIMTYEVLRKKGFPKIKTNVAYLISIPDVYQGACLQPIDVTERGSFCQINSEAFNSMRNRVTVSTSYYSNGQIRDQGKMKKFADGDRDNPIIVENGRWKYYDPEGNLVKTIHFRKRQASQEKIIKKNIPKKELEKFN